MIYYLYALLSMLYLIAMPLQCQAPWWHSYDLATTMVIKQPVADMLIKPAHHYYPFQTIQKIYQNLPLSCEPPYVTCTRAHQCLFNELMFDTRVHRNECKGNVCDAYYGLDNKTSRPYTFFYTASSHVMSLAFLKRQGLNLDLIPPPLSANAQEHKILSLLMPWYNRKTKITYSAGTRFVRCCQSDTGNTYAVHFIDFERMAPVTAHIPKNKCLLEKTRTSKQKRALFIDILTRWATQEYIFPYVLGGTSLVQMYDPYSGYTLNSQGDAQVWVRTPTKQGVQTGLDCSGLVWRAARMAGIDYFYKNTFTLSRFLTPLQRNEMLQEGDLLWMPGHVMVVANKEKCQIIEAAGYARQYGKIHRARFTDVFNNIASCDELLHAYWQRKRLVVQTRTGELQKPKVFKIFKLITQETNVGLL